MLVQEIVHNSTASFRLSDEDLPDRADYFSFHYTTHSGFRQESLCRYIFRKSDDFPIITGEHFYYTNVSSSSNIEGIVLGDSQIFFKIPSSQRYTVNGKVVTESFTQNIKIKNDIPFVYQIGKLKAYSPRDFEKISMLKGLGILTIKVPKCSHELCFIVLSGIASDQIVVKDLKGSREIMGHSYRDVILNVKNLDPLEDGTIEVLFERKYDEYVIKGDSNIFVNGLKTTIKRPYLLKFPLIVLEPI